MAYYRAVCTFFAWLERHQIDELADIEPLHVATYIECPASAPMGWTPVLRQDAPGRRDCAEAAISPWRRDRSIVISDAVLALAAPRLGIA